MTNPSDADQDDGALPLPAPPATAAARLRRMRAEQQAWGRPPITRAMRANALLVRLFVVGQPAPTRAQVRAAYPWGARKNWPYKVWCRQVRAWRAAHAQGLSQPPGRRRGASRVVHDPRQLEAFAHA